MLPSQVGIAVARPVSAYPAVDLGRAPRRSAVDRRRRTAADAGDAGGAAAGPRDRPVACAPCPRRPRSPPVVGWLVLTGAGLATAPARPTVLLPSSLPCALDDPGPAAARCPGVRPDRRPAGPGFWV